MQVVAGPQALHSTELVAQEARWLPILLMVARLGAVEVARIPLALPEMGAPVAFTAVAVAVAVQVAMPSLIRVAAALGRTASSSSQATSNPDPSCPVESKF
jgi:hypothetical protein